MKLSKFKKLCSLKDRGEILKHLAGDFSGRVTPVPIPNTAVKPSSADGTCGATHRESRSSPASFHKIALLGHKPGGAFLFLILLACSAQASIVETRQSDGDWQLVVDG